MSDRKVPDATTTTATTTRISKYRLNRQNKNSARVSRFFVHFFAVTTTTGKWLISLFMEEVDKRRLNFLSPSELEYGSKEFGLKRVRLHLTKSNALE